MADWVTFAAIVTLLTTAMVILSFRTQQTLRPVTGNAGSKRDAAHRSKRTPAVRTADSTALDDESMRTAAESEPDDDEGRTGGSDLTTSIGSDGDPIETQSVDERTREAPNGAGTDRIVAYVGETPVTGRNLLLNVAATQLLFLAVTIGVIVWAGVPGESLGLVGGVDTVLIGLGAGLGLYGASEVGGRVARGLGVDHDEWWRESLAPTSARGWAGMLGIVLPIVALFEEVLFRGVLIGAFAVGFGVSPWLLAIASSIVFSLGHGIQGRAGIVVTGVLGFVLAGAFVLTGSLLTVVVAHYVLNACEFVVHEGFALDPLG